MARDDARAERRPRRGRPRVDEHGPGAQVRIRLTAATYDELYRIAAKDERDVPDIIREAVATFVAAYPHSVP